MHILPFLTGAGFCSRSGRPHGVREQAVKGWKVFAAIALLKVNDPGAHRGGPSVWPGGQLNPRRAPGDSFVLLDKSDFIHLFEIVWKRLQLTRT